MDGQIVLGKLHDGRTRLVGASRGQQPVVSSKRVPHKSLPARSGSNEGHLVCGGCGGARNEKCEGTRWPGWNRCMGPVQCRGKGEGALASSRTSHK